MIPKINLNVIFALAFWLLILNLRLFRNYRDITFSTEVLKKHQYLFANLFWITLLLTVITVISLIFLLQDGEITKENKFAAFLTNKFSWVFSVITKLDEGKKELYGKIFEKLPRYDFLVTFTYNFIKNLKIYRLYLFAGIILPRMFIISCLIIEIYCGRLHYYYYTLILLIVPLGVQLIVYMLNDIGSRLSYVLKEYIIFETVPPESGEFVKHKESIQSLEDIPVPSKSSKVTLHYVRLKKEYQYYDLDHFMEYFFNPITSISTIMNIHFLPLYKKVRLFTLFIYFFIQTCCWGYIYFFLI